MAHMMWLFLVPQSGPRSMALVIALNFRDHASDLPLTSFCNLPYDITGRTRYKSCDDGPLFRLHLRPTI